jgi:DHA2 family multidrug resistance protein-like MFS transporter
MILSSVPPEKAGVAGALSETSAELGGALGIALLGSIGNAVYQHHMNTAALPGLSMSEREASTSTFGGALAVAKELVQPVTGMLTQAAREAFTSSITMVALVSVAIAVLSIVIARKFIARG